MLEGFVLFCPVLIVSFNDNRQCIIIIISSSCFFLGFFLKFFFRVGSPCNWSNLEM